MQSLRPVRRVAELRSLDGEHDRLFAMVNKRRRAYLRSRRSRDGTRGIHFRSLPCPRTHTLSHCIIGFPSVRFTRDCRLLRIFLLAASPSGSHHSAVGWSISAHSSFVLVEPSPPIQHLWNVAPRAGCMEHDHHLTDRQISCHYRHGRQRSTAFVLRNQWLRPSPNHPTRYTPLCHC